MGARRNNLNHQKTQGSQKVSQNFLGRGAATKQTCKQGQPACSKTKFAEIISDENVKLMGEMIALQALRSVMPYDYEVAPKLYNGLIKDLNRISQIDYTITDGYDYAQLQYAFYISSKANMWTTYGAKAGKASS